MEKATIYRAISAPTALVGGLLSLVTGGLLAGPLRDLAEDPLWFFGPWAVVLALTGAANGFFLSREAHRRGDPFFSPGMRMAIKALLPAHVMAGFVTGLTILGLRSFYTARIYLALPGLWCLAYGLGLLAMEHFAPRSLVWLGWSFLLAGLASAAIFFLGFGGILPTGINPVVITNVTMALTFGLLHLIYAAATWPRGRRSEQGGAA